MKFNREDLIARVEASKARLIARAQRQTERNEERQSVRVMRHLAGRDLTPLIDLLTRLQTENLPLTKQDLSALSPQNGVLLNGYREPSFNTLGEDGSTQSIADVSRHDALLNILRGATDEQISTTSLRDHGFRDLSNLM